MEHEEYMRQALELARLAMAEGEVPVGCVIVRDGAVVGRGRNRRETAQTALGHAELEPPSRKVQLALTKTCSPSRIPSPWSQWNGGQMTDVAGMPGTSSSSKLR